MSMSLYKIIEIQFFMLPFKATDSSMVEGDCQIQMGRFISFLQVIGFYFLLSFFLEKFE